MKTDDKEQVLKDALLYVNRYLGTGTPLAEELSKAISSLGKGVNTDLVFFDLIEMQYTVQRLQTLCRCETLSVQAEGEAFEELKSLLYKTAGLINYFINPTGGVKWPEL